jgi:hypothetical protein
MRTVTIVVPEGYESGEAFARDCGFEIVKPDPDEWDAAYNRHYEPVERRAAEIYDAYRYVGSGEKPAWAPHGNSLMQDKARREARQELRAKGHAPQS